MLSANLISTEFRKVLKNLDMGWKFGLTTLGISCKDSISDNSDGSKRPRTTINSRQMEVLKQAYKVVHQSLHRKCNCSTQSYIKSISIIVAIFLNSDQILMDTHFLKRPLLNPRGT